MRGSLFKLTTMHDMMDPPDAAPATRGRTPCTQWIPHDTLARLADVGNLRNWACAFLVCAAAAVGCNDDAPPRVRSQTNALVLTQEAKLSERIGVPSDAFARAIALDQDELFVGAAGEPDAFPGQGAVWAWWQNFGFWEERQRITAPDAAANDAFGSAIAIDGSVAFIGASGDDQGAASDRGSVYVFTRGSFFWSFSQKLLASDGLANDAFGKALATQGGSLVVGAPGRNGGRGAAYVFAQVGNVWTEQKRIDAPSSSAGDAFGSNLGLDGNTLIVGAPKYDAPSVSDAGAAWIFTGAGATWNVQHSSVGTVANGQRGSAVAIEGDRAFIGATHERSDGLGAVRALTRVGTTWTQAEELVAPSGVSGDAFGQSLNVAYPLLLVGAPERNSKQGATYAFEHDGSTWGSGQLLLTPPQAGDEHGAVVDVSGSYAVSAIPGRNGEGGFRIWQKLSGWNPDFIRSRTAAMNWDEFGVSLDMSSESLIVGARYETETSDQYERGAAFVFVRNGSAWSQQAKLVVAGSSQGDEAGYAVAIEGDDSAVGVRRDDVASNSNAGSVRVFHRSGSAWSEAATLTATPLASNDSFGSAVVMDPGTMAVGAPNRTVSPTVSTEGTVTVFVGAGSSWQKQAELSGSGTKAGAAFGSALALTGNRLVVGAPGFAGSGPITGTGATYVFSRTGTTWTEEIRLEPSPPPAPYQHAFGTSVALVGDRVFVGAPGPSGGLPGTVYVYSKASGAWSLEQKLPSPTGFPQGEFGRHLSAGPTTLVVTGHSSTTPNFELSVFELGSTWTLDQSIAPADSLFASVISGDTIVAGAPVATVNDGDIGVAYVYRIASDCTQPGVTCCANDSECTTGNYCDATGHCAPSKGLGASCNPAADCLVPATCALCLSTNCVDGVCCNTGCTDACATCAGATSTGPAGTCSAAQKGTTPTCLTNALCDGLSTSCPTTCATSVDCKPGFYCNAGSCVALQGNGTPCTSAAACTSGYCIDNVCCATECTGACQSCAAALQEGAGTDGICGPTKAGTDPGSDCAAQSPDTCGTTGFCDGIGLCEHFGNTTACGTTVCLNGSQDGLVCIAPNTCGPSGGPVSCFPYGCAGDACATSCNAESDCVDPDYLCVAGACVPGLALGDACADATACSSGFCVDGVCCPSACDGQCESCAEPGDEGNCAPVTGAPRGNRPACIAAGEVCGGACDGTDTTGCKYPGGETECSAATCTAGTSTSAGACDGTGNCGEGSSTACTPYACSATSGLCETTCTDSEDCAPGFECTPDGVCASPKPIEDAGVDSSAPQCPDGGCEPKPRPPAGGDDGCGCHVLGSDTRTSTSSTLIFSIALLALARRRRGRQRDAQRPRDANVRSAAVQRGR